MDHVRALPPPSAVTEAADPLPGPRRAPRELLPQRPVGGRPVPSGGHHFGEEDEDAEKPIILGENRFFISAGYGHGAAVVEIVRDGGRFSASTIWETTRMKNQFSASVIYDGYFYGLDGAILSCIDAQTGERMWKGGR